MNLRGINLRKKSWQKITANTSGVITWIQSDVEYDTDGFYNSTTSGIVIPAFGEGYYLIDCRYNIWDGLSLNVSAMTRLAIVRNNANIFEFSDSSHITEFSESKPMNLVSGPIRLMPGDKIQQILWHNNASCSGVSYYFGEASAAQKQYHSTLNLYRLSQ